MTDATSYVVRHRPELIPPVMRALEQLGYTRVKQGYDAFSDPEPLGLAGTFLARCYGAKAQAVRDWFADPGYTPWVQYVGARLGLAADDCAVLVEMFERPAMRADFQQAVESWLWLEECSQSNASADTPRRDALTA
jgi:hypothetical protein